MTAAHRTPSFAEYIGPRNLAVARLAGVFVAVMMPAGFVLDWFTHPEFAGSFFLLRCTAGALSLALWGITYLPQAERFVYALGLGPLLVASLGIAVMIVRLDGYESTYYAGLNLCILGVGIGFTWNIRQTTLACAIIVCFWLVTAGLTPDQLKIAPFVNNLFFLVVTSLIAVASNETRYRQVLREHVASNALIVTSDELAAALEKLRELDRVKTEFFTNISHELRTPLTLILTPVENAIAKGTAGEDEHLLETIRRNAYRLLRLIDDLLDLSRIDAGRLRLNVAPIDLPKLAEHMVEAFRPAAESRGIALSLEAPERIEDLHGDEHRLEMVLTNLIGNALKFTPDGGRIEIVVESAGTIARMSVRDTGPGISAEDQKRIFDRFYRVDAPERQQGGAGIGLSLARQLVELHGGALTVMSEPGQGSTFSAMLPRGRDHFRPEIVERRMVAVDMPGGRRASDWQGPDVEGEALPPAPEGDVPAEPPIELEGGRRARIVLVEDNDELRSLIENLLSPSFDVMTARDGEEGLSLVRKQRPDLVVSDVMMPRMSGTELCARIKQDAELKATPVILLTARSGPEAVLEGYAYGADDFVSKPLHPRILVARVRAQLRLRALSLQVLSHAKLAAVGTLAAGIGHEVRNPVNAVINGALTLLERNTLDPSARKLLEVIADAGSRIESISGALLDHAHPAEQDRPRLCDVRSGIDATLRLLEHRAREVEVHRHYESGRNVVASAGELNQVFMNLLDNAIRSTARNVWIRVADEADRLAVRIEDDGPGVPVEIAQRIFDPFFTTREPGVGTGLGLYLSSQIISKYGGVLRHEVRPGGGAIFTIDLPAEKAA